MSMEFQFEGEAVRPPPPRAPVAELAADQPPPLPRAEPSSLGWGVVGRNRYQVLSNNLGKGIVRESVGANVAYIRPPLPAGELAWTTRGKSFEMPLPCREDPAAVQKLEDLPVQRLLEYGRALQSRNFTGPDDPEIKKCNAIVDRLLALAEHLHEHGCGLGLLNPESILLLNDRGSTRVVLPDLGFVRQGMAQGRVLRWLSRESDFGQTWGPLWDKPLEEQQKIGSTFNQGPVAEDQAQTDVRTLARLLAWLLLGTTRASIPTKDEVPSTGALVWDVLDRALRGDIKKVSELRTALQAEGQAPGLHFLAPKRRLSQGGGGTGSIFGGLVKVAAVLVLLVGVLGGGLLAAIWWLNQPTGPQGPSGEVIARVDPHATPPELPADSSLRLLVQSYRDAPTPEAKYDVLIKMYQVKLSWDPDDRDIEAWHREHCRSDYIRSRMQRLARIPYDARERPSQLNQYILEVKSIRDQVKELRGRYLAHDSILREENTCLTQCQVWLAKYRLS